MISFVASENQVFCLNCKLQQSVKCIEATGLDGGAPVAREAGGIGRVLVKGRVWHLVCSMCDNNFIIYIMLNKFTAKTPMLPDDYPPEIAVNPLAKRRMLVW